MKLSWSGFGRKIYGRGDLLMEWDHVDGASYYRIFSRRLGCNLFEIRVPDWPLS
jgi:hypothetical protein